MIDPQLKPTTRAGLGTVSATFEKDYLEERDRVGPETIRLTLISRREEGYVFEIRLGEVTLYEMRCTRHFIEQFCGDPIEKTKIELKEKVTTVDGMNARPVKTFAPFYHSLECDDVAYRYLIYYTSLGMFHEFHFIMPPNLNEFYNPEFELVTATHITLTAPNATDQNLIENWLRSMKKRLPKLTINWPSERSFTFLASHLKTVKNLTINGKAYVNRPFITSFQGDVFRYEDHNGPMPFPIDNYLAYDFLAYCTIPEKKREFIFNVPQQMNKWGLMSALKDVVSDDYLDNQHNCFFSITHKSIIKSMEMTPNKFTITFRALNAGVRVHEPNPRPED